MAREQSWSWFAGGALLGCVLLREKQWVCVWDDCGTIHLLDQNGTPVVDWRGGEKIRAVGAAESGEFIVAQLQSGKLLWLNANLKPLHQIDAPFDGQTLAVDSFGQYAAVPTPSGLTLICNQRGRKVGEIETAQSLKFLKFAPATGLLLGASENGFVLCADYRGNILWTTSTSTSIGDFAIDGTGDVLLLACYLHGLERIAGDGRKEGTYRLESAPYLVTTDYDGTQIVAFSIEKQATELSYDGVVRRQRLIDDKPATVAMDALGRYLVIGYPTGEVIGVPLAAFFEDPQYANPAARSAREAPGSAATATSAWEIRPVENLDEAESALLEPTPDGRQLALLTASRTLRIWDERGRLRHESARIEGPGRGIAVGRTWLIAFTQNRLLAYDSSQNLSVPCALSAAEISHVLPLATFGDTLLVEASEYVSRFRFPGQVLWKRRMECTIDHVAALPTNWVAFTTIDRELLIYDADGKLQGKYRSKRPEAMMLAALCDRWVTAHRESKLACCHALEGEVLWTLPLSFIPWAVRRLGDWVLISSAEGHAACIDHQGRIVAQTAEPRDRASYFLWQAETPARAFGLAETLLVTTFDGKLCWRWTDERSVGSFAVSCFGVWIFSGKRLLHLPFGEAK